MDATGHPRARIRLNHTVNPGKIVDRSSFKEWCEDHMEIKVNDLRLDLNMSTVTGLADLVEDEVIPQPFPMQVSCQCTTMSLILIFHTLIVITLSINVSWDVMIITNIHSLTQKMKTVFSSETSIMMVSHPRRQLSFISIIISVKCVNTLRSIVIFMNADRTLQKVLK